MKHILEIRKTLLLLFTIVLSNHTFAQDSEKKLSFGVESEIMTWINKGYHGSLWMGRNGFRARLVIAKATYPDSFNPEGFTNLTSEFYEMEFDYFFGKKRNEFRGLWVALGTGYTKQSIESETTSISASTDLMVLHTGIGYAINIYKGLYTTPWLGMALHLNAQDVEVGNETWTPNFMDPVFGAKIGYSF
jgi:hypothetical protein